MRELPSFFQGETVKFFQREDAVIMVYNSGGFAPFAFISHANCLCVLFVEFFARYICLLVLPFLPLGW
jgi:hypothetical protein